MSVCEDEKIGGRDGVVGEGVGEIAVALWRPISLEMVAG